MPCMDSTLKTTSSLSKVFISIHLFLQALVQFQTFQSPYEKSLVQIYILIMFWVRWTLSLCNTFKKSQLPLMVNTVILLWQWWSHSCHDASNWSCALATWPKRHPFGRMAKRAWLLPGSLGRLRLAPLQSMCALTLKQSSSFVWGSNICAEQWIECTFIIMENYVCHYTYYSFTHSTHYFLFAHDLPTWFFFNEILFNQLIFFVLVACS